MLPTKESMMPKPEMNDLSYDELTQLIDEATNIRTTKFENETRELDERRRKLEQELDQAKSLEAGTR
jgi:hypothetical protein